MIQSITHKHVHGVLLLKKGSSLSRTGWWVGGALTSGGAWVPLIAGCDHGLERLCCARAQGSPEGPAGGWQIGRCKVAHSSDYPPLVLSARRWKCMGALPPPSPCRHLQLMFDLKELLVDCQRPNIPGENTYAVIRTAVLEGASVLTTRRDADGVP